MTISRGGGRLRVASSAMSFADKSAKQLALRREYRPNFPRNFANTQIPSDVPMKSPMRSRRGCEREAGEFIDQASSRRCRRSLSSCICRRTAIAVRYGREFARDVCTGDCNTDRDPRRDRSRDRRCRGPYQLGMGDRLHRRNRRDFRFAADRRVDPWNVWCMRPSYERP
jgi:hypothetical protein